MRTNIKNKKGISLIVLVLTIIVMIILAAAIILSISNSGIIGRSNEAKIKSDIKTMQEELQVLKANEALGEDDEITIDKLSSAKGYDGKFDIQDGELKFVRAGLSENEIAIAEEMDIKPYATVLKDKENGVVIENGELKVVDPSVFDLIDVKVPEGVTSIGSYGFYQCDSLKSVEFPEGLLELDSWAMAYNKNLKSVYLPTTLTSIGIWAFEECESLSDVSIPSNVTYIGSWAFTGTAITHIVIPDGVDCASSEYAQFAYCRQLESVVWPDDRTCIPDTIFYGCSKLSNIPSLASIESVSQCAFYECESLVNFDFSQNLSSIGDRAFSGSGIKSIKIPANQTNIEDGAFSNCKLLEQVEIPMSVETIGRSAFDGCVSLTSITIPSSVTSIGSDAFSNCTSLKNITIEGTLRFYLDDKIDWFGDSDLTNITITGSGYVD